LLEAGTWLQKKSVKTKKKLASQKEKKMRQGLSPLLVG
jgi:hypothetical protein